MSSFAGIIYFKKRPSDWNTLKKMTNVVKTHGHDTSILCEGEAGFGYNLLQTTQESIKETQPFSIDNKVWILADVRIDARSDLIFALRAKGQILDDSIPDVEIVLHAFYVWGEECVQYILGDFSFVIWDKIKKQLFCARDAFGVKAFYYTWDGNKFAFSNCIEALSELPKKLDELNEDAFGDFLCFGYNLDESTTIFNDIKRLPPAHVLTNRHTLRIKRYWKPSIKSQIIYKNTHDYSLHFLELFKQAVKDRIRTNNLTFELSGGLDSTAVASIAALINQNKYGFSAKALTTCNSLDPNDKEALFAKIVSDQFNFSLEQFDCSKLNKLYEYCDTPQPSVMPTLSNAIRYAGILKKEGRILLTGQGGDPVLHGSGFHLIDIYRDNTLPRFLLSIINDVKNKRTLRGHGFSQIQYIYKRNQHIPRLFMPDIPVWLNKDFIVNSKSEQRWESIFYSKNRYPSNCTCELAYDELQMPFWTHLFENYYDHFFCGMEVRHPFFDIRLIEYLMAIPQSIKRNKGLLRNSMIGILPEKVRLRPKTVPSIDLTQVLLSKEIKQSSLDLNLDYVQQYIDKKKYIEMLEKYASGSASNGYTIMAPLSLNHWLIAKQL